MSVSDFDWDGRPCTSQIAKRVINDIRSARGHVDALDEDELAKNSREWREKYLRNQQSARETHARFTKTISSQLYSSKFRFIYELLQNADDAEYGFFIRPEITFRVTQTSLIVDLNEKGFTESNVKAICATGESSKAGDASTTGEKGFGFKSVFGVSDQVHIQSGLWSFRFEHRQGDDGVGMVTPIWTEIEDNLPFSIGTRYRLRYADSTNQAMQKLVEEFDKVPSTVTFGLRKLKKVTIVLENVLGRSGEISFEREGLLTDNVVRIKTTVTGGFEAHKSDEVKLRVFRNTVSDMPSNELRQTDKSTVVIALPVDSKGYPIADLPGQNIFAYLPIQCKPEIPFLIHADFVLLASRQEIPDNEWNEKLRQGVGATFRDAVISICNQNIFLPNPLCVSWTRYLPVRPIEGFWKPLFNILKEDLAVASIVQSRMGTFRKIECLRCLPSWFLHNDVPLVPDSTQNLYLSSRYEKADVQILKSLGLKTLNSDEALVRIQSCLSSGSSNPIHTTSLNDDWHTAFTNCISWLMRTDAIKPLVRHLNIIPLSDNRWVSPSSTVSNPVYLPNLVDEGSVVIQVPNNLGFNKLHPVAYSVAERLSLYSNFGISSCDPATVITKILANHKGNRNGNVQDWRRDFEILFWFWKPTAHPFVFDSNMEPCLMAVSSTNLLFTANKLYIPSEEQYDAKKLLDHTPETDFQGFGFLHPTYLNSCVRDSIRNGVGWFPWLQKRGMSFFPALTETASIFGSTPVLKPVLNPALRLVARDNAAKFVPNLRTHWDAYRSCWQGVAEEIGGIQVPCCDGAMRALKQTFLPTEKTLNKAQEFGVQSFLPFLKLSDTELPISFEQWSFLQNFGVTCEVNATFFLSVLRLLKSRENYIKDQMRVCSKIYAGIAECSKMGDARKLLELLRKKSLVFISIARGWVSPDVCVWGGPNFLQRIHVLSRIHGCEPTSAYLFKNILSMRDANYLDAMAELESMSRQNTLSAARVREIPEIYAYLAEVIEKGKALEDARIMFSSRRLIYVRGKWLTLSECLWNCTVEIAGRTPLDKDYPNLREFFVNSLQVKTMNVNVLARELDTASRKQTPNIDEIKRIMIALGRLLGADTNSTITAENLNNLQKSAWVPVRGPRGLQLEKMNADFCVNDHERYGALFRCKARIVDFNFEELTSLHPLFQVVGIENRYLSGLVDLYTAVEGASENELLTTYFRERSYALSCCAISHNSLKYLNESVEMHSSLMGAKVFVSKDMKTELTIKQSTGDVTVTNDRAVVKLEHIDGKLRVFVPDHRDALYSCFCNELPLQLAQILGIENKAAVKPIYRILNDQERDLPTIMKDEDLSGYPWIEKPAAQQSSQLPLVSSDREDSSSMVPHTAEIVESSNSEIMVTTGAARLAGEIRSIPVTLPSAAPPISRQGPIWQIAARDQAYQKLLEEVVHQAKNVQPHQAGNLSLAEIDSALNDLDRHPDYLEFQNVFGSGNFGFEENARIGAAGELFVFEQLKALGVTHFTLDNWQSSIRHNVRALHEYRDMRPWTGREVSDIMYLGDCNQLRQFLRQHSSNAYPPWIDATTPTPLQYHIEVKTTPGPCNTPFFMSQNQYRLMRAKANDPDLYECPANLYVIVRVYNLLSSNIGVEVYVNPWYLKDKELEFVADPWKVIPQSRD